MACSKEYSREFAVEALGRNWYSCPRVGQGLVGLIAATYSSVAIAAPLVYRRGPSATPEGTAGEALPGADASALPSG